ncbi:MAG: ABC transporter permease [Myxococcota bacterium]
MSAPASQPAEPPGRTLRAGMAAVARIALRPAIAVLGSLILVGSVVALLGYPPGRALAALVAGSVGSGAACTATLLKASPLLLTGLAVALAFRCGVWNIGAEGQLLVGALCATAVATRWLPDAPALLLLPMVVLAGAAGGALMGALAGGLRARRGVNEVVSTILLNFVAIQLVALAVHGPLQEAVGAYPKSDALPINAMLPALGRLHLGLVGALGLAAAVHVLVFHTAVGFRLRAVGHAPRAARFAGISPERAGWVVLALAGGLAGLAGAFEVSGVTGKLYEGLSPGTGYTAIAVALLARLQPLAVIPSALFFGALEAGAGAMQREAGVPGVVTHMVQGLVILVSALVAFTASQTNSVSGPKNSGSKATADPVEVA